MELQELEKTLQKAYFIDANLEYAFIILVYKTESEAIEATDALIEKFQPEGAAIHISYNVKIDISIISEKTADAINIKNLDSDISTTAVLDVIMLSIKNNNHPKRDYITLTAGCFRNDIPVIPSFEKSQVIGLTDIKKMSMQFVK